MFGCLYKPKQQVAILDLTAGRRYGLLDYSVAADRKEDNKRDSRTELYCQITLFKTAKPARSFHGKAEENESPTTTISLIRRR